MPTSQEAQVTMVMRPHARALGGHEQSEGRLAAVPDLATCALMSSDTSYTRVSLCCVHVYTRVRAWLGRGPPTHICP